MTQRSYKSPDGLLTLVVSQISDDDWVIGFEGFPWHEHPDTLFERYGETGERAIQSFVAAILTNKEVILVTRRDGRVVDAFVSDNLKLSLEYLKDEEVELRYWDGSAAKSGDR